MEKNRLMVGLRLLMGMFILVGFIGLILTVQLRLEFTLGYWLITLALLVPSTYLSIALHELGHGVLGWVTGYRFLSYRFLSFMIQKNKEGKLEYKRYNIVGTGGQCLMIPPKKAPLPIFWYNFGGVFFNMIVTLIAVSMIWLATHLFVSAFMVSMVLVNVTIIIQNWVSFPGLSNDGANYREMRRNPLSQKAFRYILELQQGLAYGQRFKDFAPNYLHFEDLDFSKPLQANAGILMSLRSLFRFDFTLWQQQLNQMKSLAGEQKLLAVFIKPYAYFAALMFDEPMEKDKETTLILEKMKYDPLLQFINLYDVYKSKGHITEEANLDFEKLCLNAAALGEGKDVLDLKAHLLSQAP